MTPAERTLLLLLAEERLKKLDPQYANHNPPYYWDILLAKQAIEEEINN